MSYYNDASLVLLAQDLGKKAGSVAAQKPMDANGQMTFTRTGDTATRVNASGLIEKVRTNVLTYSEDFSNATWTDHGGTVTPNVAISPDGTMNADLFDGTPAGRYKTIAGGSTTQYTVSAWAKLGTATNVVFIINDTANWNTVGGKSFASADGLNTTTWTRVSFTFAAPVAGNINWHIGQHLEAGVTPQSSGTFYLWGAQLEAGDIATDYIATTTAAVSVGPVANVPRLDYLNSSCPRLLLEPQRTNLALNSESFNSSLYTKVRATITANAITSPDGYTNADKMESTAGATLAVECYQTITTTAQTYTASAFFKQGSGANDLNHLDVYYLGTGTYNASVKINLSTGVLTQTIGTGASVVNYGNGWYRVLVPFTASAGSTAFYFGSDGAHYASGSFVYLYGAQVEAGAYATSYIPTLGAAVTRGADAASKTGISSLIGQTEGTLFCEISKEAIEDGARYMSIGATGSGTNRLVIYQGTNVLNVYCGVGATFNLTYNPPAGPLKIAVAYKSGDYAWYVNGVQVATNTLAAVPTCSELNIGTNEITAAAQPAEVTYSQALLFKTRLTNAQLAELTTI